MTIPGLILVIYMCLCIDSICQTKGLLFLQDNVSRESCRQDLGLLSEISRGLTLKSHGATKKVFGMIFYRPINTDGIIPEPLFF